MGALAVDTGTGLHAKDAGAAYDRLVDPSSNTTRRRLPPVTTCGATSSRLGFLDQAASAALVAVARRQDELNRAAWRGLAEAGTSSTRSAGAAPTGLASMVHTYAQAGRCARPRTTSLIALVRSDVELRQTELDDTRRAVLLARVDALVGGRGTVDVGELARGRCVASDVRADGRGASRGSHRRDPQGLGRRARERRPAPRRERASSHATTRRPSARRRGRDGRLPELDQLPAATTPRTKVVDSDAELQGPLRSPDTRLEADWIREAYPGERHLRSDDVEVRLRRRSTSGGATIDLVFPDGTKRKVHIR